MSSSRKKVADAAVKVTHPSETTARERAENEGMPARVSLPPEPPTSALEGEGSRMAARQALDGGDALREAESAVRLGQGEKATATRQP